MSSNQTIKEQVATCHTCHWPIYKGDLIHYSSTGGHQGNIDAVGASQRVGRGPTIHGSHGWYSGTSHSDQWIQCQWCINQWNKEIIVSKVWKRKCWWITLLITTILIGLPFCLSYKNNMLEMLLMGLVGSLMMSFIFYQIITFFFAPKPNRYRFGGYRKKQKSIKN